MATEIEELFRTYENHTRDGLTTLAELVKKLSVQQVSATPAHVEISKDVEAGRVRYLLPYIDLIEQFMEYVASEKVWWLSNPQGYMISRESVGEQIREFARVAKPLNDPMGSHEDKLKDFLVWQKKNGYLHSTQSPDYIVQRYWTSFQ